MTWPETPVPARQRYSGTGALGYVEILSRRAQLVGQELNE